MTVQIEDLLAVAAANGLPLDPETARLDETGADFRAVHGVDEQGLAWIARFPRRPDVWERAEHESRILEFVRGRIPVAVPEWRIATREVIAYPRVPGNPLATIDMEAGDYAWCVDRQSPPAAFVDSLGRTLAALHGIEVEAAVGAGFRVSSPEQVRRVLAEQAERTRGILDVPEATYARWRRWLAEDSYWNPRVAVIHGDLQAAHVLLAGDGHVTGVLDWTEAEVGDPATDFALLYGAMGEGVLDALLERYTRAGGRTWPRMKEHVVERWHAFPIAIAIFAEMTGDPAHVEFGQMMLGVLGGGGGE
jgi:macrolide phosphotransferase